MNISATPPYPSHRETRHYGSLSVADTGRRGRNDGSGPARCLTRHLTRRLPQSQLSNSRPALPAGRSIGLLAILVAVMTGCAAPVKQPPPAGFLKDYSRLEQVDDKHLLYSNGKAASYQSFLIDPPVVLYQPADGDDEFTAEELAELQDHFVEALTKQLTRGDDGYQVVEQPGPDTARFRTAITDLDASNGALNLTIYTKITGAGLGGIAAEGELVDSVTGEQLAAAVRWGSGSRILRAGFSRLGDAKLQIDRWCKDIRRRLDEARASSQG